MAVRDLENLVGHDVGVRIADAPGHFAGNEIVEGLVRKHADLAVDESGIHQAAAARLLALDERGENADHRIDAGEDVGDRNAGALRFAVRRPGQIHDPAHALGHEVVAGTRGVGATLAEAGHRAIDQARVLLAQAPAIETELGKPADLEVLDQHVRACGQLLDNPASIFALEIELDRPLTPVGGVEIGGAEMPTLGRLDKRRAPATRLVTASFSLNFNYFTPQLAENLPPPT